MKTLLKYITLLIFGGVIIPLYQPASPAKCARVIALTASATPAARPANHNGVFHLYFIHDIMAKLCPLQIF